MTRMGFYLFVVVRTSSRPMAVTRQNGRILQFPHWPPRFRPVATVKNIGVLSPTPAARRNTWPTVGAVLGGVEGGSWLLVTRGLI